MEANILKSVMEGSLEKQKLAVAQDLHSIKPAKPNRDGQGTMKARPSLRNSGN